MEVGAGEVEAVEDIDARADEALDRFLPPSDDGVVVRSHQVTALLLSRDGAQWLPRTLAAVAGQHRAADRVLGIDAGSTDTSAQLLRGSVGCLEVEDPGLADALAAGVASITTGTEVRDDSGPVEWFWVVHDDSAPDPGCLAALLRGADRHPEAAVLVPKSVAWSDPGRLVGVGSRWAPGTPVVDPLEPNERDQGQYDEDRPVYTGDSAGMLIRADVWRALDGLDPSVGDWAGPADLCRRTWAIGSEVWFLPKAVVAHRQAGHRGVRPTPGSRHPRRSARGGQLILELSQAPAAALPWRYIRAWMSTLIRAIALLLTREPEEASAELAGAWSVLGQPGWIHRVRRALRRPPVADLTRPSVVRARRGAALSHSLDRWTAGSRGPAHSWWPPPGRVWHPLAVAGVLAVAAFVRDPGLMLGAGTVRGGGLLPAPGAGDLMAGYLSSWHPPRFGDPLPLPAHLPLLAASSVPLLGSVDTLLRLAFGLAVPLAFLSCYASLGRGWAGRHRIAAALGYAFLPAGVAAVGGGRISTLAVLLLGPPTARLVIRALTPAASPPRGIRPALAAGTMVGILVSFAPSVYAVLVVAAVLAGIGLRVGRGRHLHRSGQTRTALIILAVGGVFLALWGVRVLRAPWLALSELGVNDPSLGSPGPSIWGLAPGGPTSVAWAGIPLLVLALVVVAAQRFQVRALAQLAAAVVLLAVSAWLDPIAARLWPELGRGMLWPGVFLLLAAALLVLVVAAAAARPGATGELFFVGWVLGICVLAVGWWVAPTTVGVGSATGIPPVVGLDGQSPSRPRSLVLERVSGELHYAVASTPQVHLGDADSLAGSTVDPGFADAVAGLVSGASGQVEAELGGRAIRYVVFDGPPEDPLVAELDATFGLRQLARAPEQSLWLVTGDPVRAELVDPAEPTKDQVPETPIEVPVLTSPTTVDVVLHPLTPLPRQLVVAERADPGWRGSLDGVPLPLVPDSQGMLTAPVNATGDLVVTHRGWWPVAAIAQLGLIVVLLLIALPKRRTLDPDAIAPDSGVHAAGSAEAGDQPAGDQRAAHAAAGDPVPGGPGGRS